MKFGHLKIVLWLFALGASASFPAAAAQREVATNLGFSIERLNEMDRFYEDKVRRGDLSGIVILIARHSQIVHFQPIGYADIERRAPMRKDTLFRAYSMTKPITATALMTLYEQGCFGLDDPLSKFLRGFANMRVLKTPESPLSDTVPARREPTIHDLLRHTAGLGHGFQDNAVDRQYMKDGLFSLDLPVGAMTAKLAGIPLLYQPGERFNYSVAPDIEARLVELLSGKPFDEFIQQEIFAPLGMTDTGFSVRPDQAGRLATLYWRKDDKLVPDDEAHGYPVVQEGFLAQPWSVNSYGAEHPRKGGSFGLVTTARDYWHFGQMLLDRGHYGNSQILSPHTVKFMTRNHLDSGQKATFPNGLAWGLGFALLEDPAQAGFMGTEGSFYWMGAGNTHFWVDPAEDLVVVALSQDMGNPRNAALSTEIRSWVYGALEE